MSTTIERSETAAAKHARLVFGLCAAGLIIALIALSIIASRSGSGGDDAERTSREDALDSAVLWYKTVALDAQSVEPLQRTYDDGRELTYPGTDHTYDPTAPEVIFENAMSGLYNDSPEGYEAAPAVLMKGYKALAGFGQDPPFNADDPGKLDIETKTIGGQELEVATLKVDEEFAAVFPGVDDRLTLIRAENGEYAAWLIAASNFAAR